MTRIRRILLRVAFLSTFVILGVPAWGQTSTSLRGTVTDASGGVVVGAKVAVTNAGTGISRTTTSGNDGAYVFDPLSVGTYRIRVEKSGFATFVQEGIVLELNQSGRLDVALKVGESSQTVEVTANVAQVDTTGAVLGKVENQRMINDLPLLDRDTLQLGLLQAGVFSPDPDDGSGNPFSVSGQRSESLTFLLDGANNTDFLGNNIVVSPNPDAVEEFKILTNNYDAEYGRTSGGIVNQITRSGTNSYHGDLFEFNRNDVFNARDYFLPSTEPKQNFKRNVFGGTVGGPIKKDKTFFFLAYQGWRSREGQTSPELTVLSKAERGGNFGELCPPDPATGATFDGSGNCVSSIGTQLTNPASPSGVAPYPYNVVPVDPIIASYISKYLPLPNLPGNGFIASPTADIDQEQGIAHLDHNFSTHDAISFVYLINDTRDQYPYQIVKGASTGGDVPIGSGFSDKLRNQIGTFSWNHTLSGGRLNEFRFAINRAASVTAIPLDTTSPQTLGFTNVFPADANGTAPPAIQTPSFNLGPSPQGPTKIHDVTFQWADNYTWTKGKHEWKFGADVTRVRNNFHYDFYNNGGYYFGQFGSFTGDPLADFVGGFYDQFYQVSHADYGIRTGSIGLFAQDSWKVLPRLTLSLGLRWDYFMVQTDNNSEISGWFPGAQSTLFPGSPPDILYVGDPGTPNKGLVYPDYNNFAPRFGLAWDMFGNSKLVMRGGFGIFYDIEDGALNLQFGGQPPFGGETDFYPSGFNSTSGGTCAPPTNGSFMSDPFTPFCATNPITGAPFVRGTFFSPAIPFGYLAYPHFRTPYSEHFNYGFQWQATKNTMVEAVYVGSLGRKLISSAETNFPSQPVMQEQLTNFGATNPECARPLANCYDYSLNQYVTGANSGPNAFPTGAGELLVDLSNGLSDSHEFQLTVDKRFSKQFAFRAAYTLSKTIDLTSGFRARSFQFTDPYDYRLDRSVADFDVPQRIVISGIWELPFDRHFQSNEIMKKVTGGWQFSGIATFQKGQPFTIYSDNNSSQQDNFLDRPDLIGPIQYLNPRHANQTFNANDANCLASTGTQTGNFWFNPTAYDCVNVPMFTYGTLGRNALRGPGINNFDLSIMKRTSITESKSLEFRAEFFNAFNHAQFLMSTQGYTADSGTFGEISSDRNPRLIQLGLKLYF